MQTEILKVYFPYGLYFLSDQRPTEPCRLLTFTDRVCILEDPWNKKWEVPADSEEYRPMLYPLSCLDTPVLVKSGQKVNPMDRLGEWLSARSEVLKVDPRDRWFRDLIIDYFHNRNTVPFTHEIMKTLYNLLYRFHFDLDRLIETGKAIDVTTFPANPYDFFPIETDKSQKLLTL